MHPFGFSGDNGNILVADNDQCANLDLVNHIVLTMSPWRCSGINLRGFLIIQYRRGLVFMQTGGESIVLHLQRERYASCQWFICRGIKPAQCIIS
jgi:hypothetical protein